MTCDDEVLNSDFVDLFIHSAAFHQAPVMNPVPLKMLGW